jgi:hypothetical protein
MMIKEISFFMCIFIVVFTGCVSVPKESIRANSTNEIPSIQQKYSDRFERTRIGMDLSEFRQIWPEAIKSGETQEFVIYEFKEITIYYTDNDYNVGFWWTGSAKTSQFVQTELFYFTNNKLVKYEYISGSS